MDVGKVARATLENLVAQSSLPQAGYAAALLARSDRGQWTVSSRSGNEWVRTLTSAYSSAERRGLEVIGLRELDERFASSDEIVGGVLLNDDGTAIVILNEDLTEVIGIAVVIRDSDRIENPADEDALKVAGSMQIDGNEEAVDTATLIGIIEASDDSSRRATIESLRRSSRASWTLGRSTSDSWAEALWVKYSLARKNGFDVHGLDRVVDGLRQSSGFVFVVGFVDSVSSVSYLIVLSSALDSVVGIIRVNLKKPKNGETSPR